MILPVGSGSESGGFRAPGLLFREGTGNMRQGVASRAGALETDYTKPRGQCSGRIRYKQQAQEGTFAAAETGKKQRADPVWQDRPAF